MSNWTPCTRSRPEKNQRVEWITPSGEVVRGKYAGGLIWFPEGSPMYIYYTPICWRPLEPTTAS
jgi:hypothetical protein